MIEKTKNVSKNCKNIDERSRGQYRTFWFAIGFIAVMAFVIIYTSSAANHAFIMTPEQMWITQGIVMGIIAIIAIIGHLIIRSRVRACKK